MQGDRGRLRRIYKKECFPCSNAEKTPFYPTRISNSSLISGLIVQHLFDGAGLKNPVKPTGNLIRGGIVQPFLDMSIKDIAEPFPQQAIKQLSPLFLPSFLPPFLQSFLLPYSSPFLPELFRQCHDGFLLTCGERLPGDLPNILFADVHGIQHVPENDLDPPEGCLVVIKLIQQPE